MLKTGGTVAAGCLWGGEGAGGTGCLSDGGADGGDLALGGGWMLAGRAAAGGGVGIGLATRGALAAGERGAGGAMPGGQRGSKGCGTTTTALHLRHLALRPAISTGALSVP
jgi:hypothetical protein